MSQAYGFASEVQDEPVRSSSQLWLLHGGRFHVQAQGCEGL